MGFFDFRFLVNFVLLAIPIGITLGVLFGIDAERASSGQTPIYTPTPTSSSGSGSSGGGGLSDDRLTTKTYCQKSYGITPVTKGQEFTLNPNQWGWDASEGGGLCMNVTTYDNSTYPTNTTAPEWSVTWEYPAGPETQPVHAYPNIIVDGGVFPATVDSLTQIGVDLQWSYTAGNTSSNTTDETTLTSTTVNANTNVAFDMFLDADSTNSTNSSLAKYEIMVWMADFGTATQPIGLSAGAVTTQTLNGTTFSLYKGTNSLEQIVLTWVAATTVSTFSGDLLPLFTKIFGLTSTTTDEYPTEADYLGYMAFGSEAYYSDAYVTFTVSELSIDVRTS